MIAKGLQSMIAKGLQSMIWGGGGGVLPTEKLLFFYQKSVKKLIKKWPNK